MKGYAIYWVHVYDPEPPWYGHHVTYLIELDDTLGGPLTDELADELDTSSAELIGAIYLAGDYDLDPDVGRCIVIGCDNWCEEPFCTDHTRKATT